MSKRSGYMVMWCSLCGWEGERYRNVKKCPKCKGDLCKPHDLPLGDDVCPTCKRPYKTGQTKRICAKCGKQIGTSDKWQIIGSRIAHRVCERPESYS